MQIALNASVQGVQRATERMSEAAAMIAAPAPASARGADPSPAPPTGNDALTAIQARRAYEANAKALERNAETERALISRGA